MCGAGHFAVRDAVRGRGDCASVLRRADGPGPHPGLLHEPRLRRHVRRWLRLRAGLLLRRTVGRRRNARGLPCARGLHGRRGRDPGRRCACALLRGPSRVVPAGRPRILRAGRQSAPRRGGRPALRSGSCQRLAPRVQPAGAGRAVRPHVASVAGRAPRGAAGSCDRAA